LPAKAKSETHLQERKKGKKREGESGRGAGERFLGGGVSVGRQYPQHLRKTPEKRENYTKNGWQKGVHEVTGKILGGENYFRNGNRNSSRRGGGGNDEGK